MLKVVLFLLLASLDLAADEQTRVAQRELKRQGFYFGEITGELDEPTGAAIKRFQIRSGLDATGKLDAETLKSLEAKPTQSAAEPARAHLPPPSPRPQTPRQANANLDARRSLKSAEPLRGIWVDRESPYEFIFKDSILETAPAGDQHETIVRAQKILREDGFYYGPADGFPSEELQLALVRYQSVMQLPRTGNLDTPTLGTLGLLPRPTPPVHRGIWVR